MMSILKTRLGTKKVSVQMETLFFWFQEGLSFPQMYLVTTPQKFERTLFSGHSKPDYIGSAKPYYDWVVAAATFKNGLDLRN